MYKFKIGDRVRHRLEPRLKSGTIMNFARPYALANSYDVKWDNQEIIRWHFEKNLARLVFMTWSGK